MAWQFALQIVQGGQSIPPHSRDQLTYWLPPRQQVQPWSPPDRKLLRKIMWQPRPTAATDLSSEHKLNKSQQLKKVFKEYGAVGVSFHVGISLVSLGIFYLAVSSGVDMTAVLFKLGFSESSLQSKRAAGTGTFLLAYAIHKLFAPVRISITRVSVPFIVRYCWKIGFFKPPTPNP
uniref:DUF1279 domain-containing protein n=1 Tax=Anser brachyrhynchus TaxID=132585 RepID=A0A8B9BTD2_9AVES